MFHQNSFTESTIKGLVKNRDITAITTYIHILKTTHVSYPGEWVRSKNFIIPNAIRDAILSGYSDIVQLFLNEGVDANEVAQEIDGRGVLPLLYFAVHANNQEIVEALVKKGARVKSKNENSSAGMAMELAVKNNLTNIAVFLLNHGAAAHEVIGYWQEDFYLGRAARHENSILVDELISHGADIYQSIKLAFDNYRKFTERFAIAKNKSVEEFESIKKGYTNVIRLLLDRAHGIDFPGDDEINNRLYMGLKFINGLNVSGFNFRRISIAGKLVTREMLIENGATEGVMNAIITKDDRDNIQDEKRREELIQCEEKCDKMRGRLVIDTVGDIVNVVPLWRAAAGDIEAVKARLENGVNPNHFKDSTNLDNEVPIIVAAKNGQSAIVKMLVEHKDIDKRSIVNAMKVAKNNNYADIVSYLEEKLEVNAQDKSGNTLLHNAVRCHDVKEVMRLIEKGADVNIKNNEGETVLSLAAWFSSYDDNTIRLEYLKILNIILNHHPNHNDFPAALSNAVEASSAMAVKMLLAEIPDEKADIEIIDYSLDSGTKQLYPWYIDLVFKAMNARNNIDILTSLKNHGADFNIQKKRDNTTLLCSAISALPSFQTILLQLQELSLVTVGCESRLSGNSLQNQLRNSIADAKREFPKHLLLLDFLLENGAKPSVGKFINGETPLHVLAAYADLQHLEKGYEEVIDRLLKYGADVNAPDKSGNTPIHAAVSSGNRIAINYLYLHGGNIHATNKDLSTPLHIAAQKRLRFTFELLIKLGARSDVKDKDGLTPEDIYMKAHEYELKYNAYRYRDEKIKNDFDVNHNAMLATFANLKAKDANTNAKDSHFPKIYDAFLSLFPKKNEKCLEKTKTVSRVLVPSADAHVYALAFHKSETPELLRQITVGQKLAKEDIVKIVQTVFSEQILLEEDLHLIVSDLIALNAIASQDQTRSIDDIYLDFIKSVRQQAFVCKADERKGDLAFIKAMLDFDTDTLPIYVEIAADLVRYATRLEMLSEDDLEIFLAETRFNKISKNDSDELIGNLMQIHSFANCDKTKLGLRSKVEYKQAEIVDMVYRMTMTIVLEKARDLKVNSENTLEKTSVVDAMQLAGGSPIISRRNDADINAKVDDMQHIKRMKLV